MAADVLALGSIIFTNFSTPERMPFGGEHCMNVHKLIGGQRVVDTMGPDDRDIRWSGVFWGDNALNTAQELDALRVQGSPLGLSWGGGAYTVVIKSFVPDVRRLPMCVDYSIECVISSRGSKESWP